MKRLPALLAAAGLLCSIVLEVVHIRAYVDPSASSFCRAGEAADCGTVALSHFSVVAGIPVPVWGVVGFAVLLAAALRESAMLLPLSAFAAAASLMLLGIELIAIHSVCLLCEGVHVASWALFAVAYRRRSTLTHAPSSEWTQAAALAAVALGAAYVFVPPYWATYSWRAGVHVPHGVLPDGSHWIGAENPKVTVLEYVDYACPHCALSASRMRRVLAKNANTLRVVRKEVPRMSCGNPANKHACAFVRGALCASKQNRFWEMDSWLFEHAPGKVDLNVDEAARDLSLDLPAFSACVAAPETYAAANEFDKAAGKLHIVETPVYLIDGKRYSAKDVFSVVSARL